MLTLVNWILVSDKIIFRVFVLFWGLELQISCPNIGLAKSIQLSKPISVKKDNPAVSHCAFILYRRSNEDVRQVLRL